MSIETQTHIGCLIVRKVCGRAGKGLQREIEGWISHNGAEWTVSRIKAIWNAALHLRNGDPVAAQAVYRENSIAYHHGTMLPKGNWGYVVRHFLTARKPSVLRRYAAVMRFYTCLRASEETPKQTRKYVKAIAGPWQPNPTCWITVPTIKEGLLRSLNTRLQESHETGWHWETDGSGWMQKQPTVEYRREDLLTKCNKLEEAQQISDLSGSSYFFSDKPIPREIRDLPYGKLVWSWISNEKAPTNVTQSLPVEDLVSEVLLMGDFGRPPAGDHLGRIQVLQEQGCKARVVFQPTARIQFAMRPLHKVLADFIERKFNKESCVRNQVKGIYAALELLEDGKDVYSVDLSSATDRFPRSITLSLLDAMGLQKYSQIVTQICMENFPVAGHDGMFLKYATGQPMGLYGSFPMFHMSNLLVADYAKRLVINRPGRHAKPTSFRDGSFCKVLGDDIILPDADIAAMYRDIMNALGVDISVNKSFSGKVAEFAGFIALPLREGRYTAFRPYKVPDGSKITNPLEFLHGLGVKCTSLGPYWKRMFAAYSRTLGDRDLSLEPLVPDDDRPKVFPKGNSRWMNALANVCYAKGHLDLGDQAEYLDPSDTALVNAAFHERGNVPLSQIAFVPDTYISLSQREKARRRSRSHHLSDDPLIREYRTKMEKAKAAEEPPPMRSR